jgi:uncharacterized membrane protein YbhN (UPF0104 family)
MIPSMSVPAADHVDLMPPEAVSLRARLLRIAMWLGGLLAVLVVLELIGVSPLNWLRAVFHAMGEIPPQYIVAGIFTQTCNLLLVGLAYVAIWRAAFPGSKAIPVMQIATCYIVSIALNGVLPMSLGTITMIFMFIAILPGATAAGVAAGYGVGQIFWAVASAFTYSYLFITVSGAINEAIGGIRNHLPALALILVGVVILVIVLFKLLRQKIHEGAANLKQGAVIMQSPSVFLLRVFLPCAIAFCFEIATVAIFMHGYGIPVSLRAILLNDAANSIATLTAVTPGGVGATQGLTTIALSGVAPPSQIAAYSLAQQLILTAWNCAFAVVCVTFFFGWAGGREIVTNSLVRARTELAEKRAAGKQAKAGRQTAE